MNHTDIFRRLKTRLKTRHMLLLIALDDARNMHEAANLTNMTQPGASKMLKDIEGMLGAPLFERLPRGVHPTVLGTALIRHVRLALEHIAQGQEEVAAIGQGISGHVAIGVIIAPALTLVPQAVARTKTKAPNLRIGIETGTSNDLVSRLKRGHLDFLLARILEQEDEPGLLYEEIGEETECIVARVGHPLLDVPRLKLKDLSEGKWILSPRGSILRNRFDMMFRCADLAIPSNVIEVTSVSIITGLLQQTDFLNIMPTDVANHYAKMGALAILPIEIPCRIGGYGMIWHRDRLLSPGAELLMKHMRETANEIAARNRTDGCIQ